MKDEIQLYPFPETGENSKLRIYDLKYADNDLKNPLPHYAETPHKHDFYEIAIFFKGGGSHEIDFIEYPIYDNSLHFVAPGQVHLIKREKQSEGLLIIFDAEFYGLNFVETGILNRLFPFKSDMTHSTMVLQEGEFSLFRQLIERMKYFYASNYDHKTLTLCGYLNIILLEADKIFMRENSGQITLTSGHEMVTKFRHILEQDFISKTLVKDYASALAITPVHLNNTVKKITGRTASDHLKDRRTLEAKRLLSFTDKSAKEVAHHLSFDDSSHFNRFFKKQTGETPQQFRRNFYRLTTAKS